MMVVRLLPRAALQGHVTIFAPAYAVERFDGSLTAALPSRMPHPTAAKFPFVHALPWLPSPRVRCAAEWFPDVRLELGVTHGVQLYRHAAGGKPWKGLQRLMGRARGGAALLSAQMHRQLLRGGGPLLEHMAIEQLQQHVHRPAGAQQQQQGAALGGGGLAAGGSVYGGVLPMEAVPEAQSQGPTSRLGSIDGLLRGASPRATATWRRGLSRQPSADLAFMGSVGGGEGRSSRPSFSLNLGQALAAALGSGSTEPAAAARWSLRGRRSSSFAAAGAPSRGVAELPSPVRPTAAAVAVARVSEPGRRPPQRALTGVGSVGGSVIRESSSGYGMRGGGGSGSAGDGGDGAWNSPPPGGQQQHHHQHQMVSQSSPLTRIQLPLPRYTQVHPQGPQGISPAGMAAARAGPILQPPPAVAKPQQLSPIRGQAGLLSALGLASASSLRRRGSRAGTGTGTPGSGHDSGGTSGSGAVLLHGGSMTAAAVAAAVAATGGTGSVTPSAANSSNPSDQSDLEHLSHRLRTESLPGLLAGHRIMGLPGGGGGAWALPLQWSAASGSLLGSQAAASRQSLHGSPGASRSRLGLRSREGSVRLGSSPGLGRPAALAGWRQEAGAGAGAAGGAEPARSGDGHGGGSGGQAGAAAVLAASEPLLQLQWPLHTARADGLAAAAAAARGGWHAQPSPLGGPTPETSADGAGPQRPQPDGGLVLQPLVQGPRVPLPPLPGQDHAAGPHLQPEPTVQRLGAALPAPDPPSRAASQPHIDGEEEEEGGKGGDGAEQAGQRRQGTPAGAAADADAEQDGRLHPSSMDTSTAQAQRQQRSSRPPLRASLSLRGPVAALGPTADSPDAEAHTHTYAQPVAHAAGPPPVAFRRVPTFGPIIIGEPGGLADRTSPYMLPSQRPPATEAAANADTWASPSGAPARVAPHGSVELPRLEAGPALQGCAPSLRTAGGSVTVTGAQGAQVVWQRPPEAVRQLRASVQAAAAATGAATQGMYPLPPPPWGAGA